MSKTINTFVAEPFTNKIGQTINPGDPVAYVTSGYSVHTNKGWYDGMFKDKNGNVVLTRIRGIVNTKSVPTGKMITEKYKSTKYNPETREYEIVDKSYTYAEHITVDCEPHGTTLLQKHRMFKI
jgi:hypothetical protein